MRRTHKTNAPMRGYNGHHVPTRSRPERRHTSIVELLRLLAPLAGQPIGDITAFVHGLFGDDMSLHWSSQPIADLIMFAPSRHAVALQHFAGLILDRDMKVVSSGARMLAPRETPRKLVADDYIVHDAVDGTQVTLYWRDKWIISTANGIDVCGYQWLGQKTFWQAFTERCEEIGLDIEMLDHDFAYTFVFRDHDFHPLRTDPESIWFISAQDVAALNNGAEQRCADLAGMPHQRATSMAEVIARCRDAFTAYKNALATGSPPPHYYGATLTHVAGGPSYVIESSLMRRVRKFMYTLPPQQMLYVGKITSTNRLAYITLRAYLSPNRADFLVLYPQYVSTMTVYGRMFQTLAGQIVANMRDRQPAEAVTASERLAVQLAAHLRDTTQLNAMDASGPGIVYDFLMQPEHVDTFYETLVHAGELPTRGGVR